MRTIAVNQGMSIASVVGLSCFILMQASSHLASTNAQLQHAGKAASDEPKDEKDTALKGPYLGQSPPGAEPEVFAPGIITSANINHSAPAFSPDGDEIYWSRVQKHPPRVRILHMQRVEEHWSKPSLVPFSSNADDDCPVFSPDGRRLYFVSHRPVEASGIDEKENIWFVEKQGPGWSDAIPVSPVVNRMNLHWQVSVSSDYTLYFACTQDKTTRIYCSRLIDGSYAEAEALPYPINSGSGEETPWVAPNESYIIFSSQRKGGRGGADLYISFRSAQKNWLEPVNLGPKVNSRSYELLPYVSPDHKYLFFVSARGGEYDVYWVESKIIDRLKQQLDTGGTPDK